VLGVVSRYWTPRELWHRRMEVVSFGVGCIALTLMFSPLWHSMTRRFARTHGLKGRT